MPLSPLDDDHGRRFGGIDRLYGDGARLTLHQSHLAVVGVGGVGSWVVEALARSGIGQLTLIDLDHIAVSNINRQIQALDSTLGQAKVQALATRIRDINPACQLNLFEDFLDENNLAQLISPGRFDAVVDACDDGKTKTALIVHARQHKIPLIVCGAAGGKSNPLNLRQDDLGRVTHDALLSRIRNQLKKKYQLQPRKNGKFSIACVYLEEASRRSSSCTTGDLNCAGYGSAVTVTAAMGFAAAAWCLEKLLAEK